MDENLLQVRRGDRFAFGRNWKSFVGLVDEDRIRRAVDSLRATLGVEDLAGRTFLDVGCGSGLFSLAAYRLGARVHSFDSDAEAVESAVRLRRAFAPEASGTVEGGTPRSCLTVEREATGVSPAVEREPAGASGNVVRESAGASGNVVREPAGASGKVARESAGACWTIEKGSILDGGRLARLGTFDVVYAWGVLHHTGHMWRAFDAAVGLVAPGGLLFVSLYNDQGGQSRVWTAVKRRYNRSGPVTRGALIAGSALYVYRAWPLLRIARLLRGGAGPADVQPRGMSRRHDMLDWVGGYPFEVSRPEQVLARARAHDLGLLVLKTCAGGLGCNEYLLRRPDTSDRPAGGRELSDPMVTRAPSGTAGAQEPVEPSDDLSYLGGTRDQPAQGHPG
ncbi:class I SAM-dependent methyltransferase [Streptosporangium sp. DT93]|uniref:class I SAM-dependent methyltransferase n=1 Tax=Streptosporangium sp. DT93 TaxID=3393428 RepID=UPI003CEAD060